MIAVLEDLLARDRAHLWHPYSTMTGAPPVFPVVSASGVRLRLADGTELIDGMASWWCAVHGYNHPVLNEAIRRQLDLMAHVMFGGLTHEPAVRLAEKLVGITPPGLETVFFADSGSVSVEVAIKMSVQYQAAIGRPARKKLLALRGGYHGDTFGAMAVCDPISGMHARFRGALIEQYFADRPRTRFGDTWDEHDADSAARALEKHGDEIAAVILEPVVQGAGGMWFYHPAYVGRMRELCDRHGVLLIADEIATGFGRTGRLFACEYAGISPDILCAGKALTGGCLTLAATLTTRSVAEAISAAGPLMHGPTFMANPLACAAALASIDLLLGGSWQQRVGGIEAQLKEELEPCRALAGVADVRVLGAIGVVELHEPVDMHRLPAEFARRGVWIRPFGKLLYLMPPYIIGKDEISLLTGAVFEVLESA
jgi:adenosylmethionine-8-amino-7-oxononanoate aminotransferase